MLAIFSTGKGLRNDPQVNFRQQNALFSWLQLTKHLYFADDTDAVKRSDMSNAPILPDLFQRAEERFKNANVLSYVNSDIMLLSDFLLAVAAVRLRFLDRFLMVGRRWNWHHPVPLQRLVSATGDLTKKPWEEALIRSVKENGKLFNPATDYFAFPPGMFDYKKWPKLVVGRYWWDPWIFWHAMQEDIPVIDATKAVLAIHQDHPVGKRSWDPEGERNRFMAKAAEVSGIDLDDVPYELTEGLEIVERASSSG